MPDSPKATLPPTEHSQTAERDYEESLAKLDQLRNFVLVFMGAYLSVSLSEFKIVTTTPNPNEVEPIVSFSFDNANLFFLVLLSSIGCYLASFRKYFKYSIFLFTSIIVFLTLFHYKFNIFNSLKESEFLNLSAFLLLWLIFSLILSWIDNSLAPPPAPSQQPMQPLAIQAEMELQFADMHIRIREMIRQIDERDKLISDLQQRVEKLKQACHDAPGQGTV